MAIMRGSISAHGVIVVQVNGAGMVPALLEDLLLLAESEGIETSLLLGPTDPTDSPLFVGHRIGWLTWEENCPQARRPQFRTINPSELVELRLFISQLLDPAERGDRSSRLAVLGDFLDSVFCSVSSTETLFILMSQIATRIKAHDATGVFVISEELHDEAKLAIVRRFADAVYTLSFRKKSPELDEQRTLLRTQTDTSHVLFEVDPRKYDSSFTISEAQD